MSPEGEFDDEFSWQQELALCALFGLAMIAGSVCGATLMYKTGPVTLITGLVTGLAVIGVLLTLRKTRGG